ncbi:MAG: pyridoxal phosphate-dependent aminotransferase [Chloroflexota bacterium]|nr:pyridoxal phosphate-dependent aminotransferase [Chloroflexota bacterium]MDE3102275.1 pyridoxal phosphate-dependent aminotransferase [Chloroflexota bacterium]
MRPLASRMSRLGTETAFEVLAKARALEATGRDVVHLEIGEPDFDTPPSIVAAAVAALERGETHYTPSAGVVELREAIARNVTERRGVAVDPSQVIVAPGAKPIMFYALLALLEDGDEAIYPDPGFPIYSSMIDFAGARGIPWPLRERNAFDLDPDELRSLVTPRTKVVILNSPHNPTGAVLSPATIRAIADVARERDLWVLSDEIYADILYEGEHRSILREAEMPERSILLDGFSKTFAMTGWRLGFGVFPAPLVQPVTKLVTNSVSCTATFTQRAGVVALETRPPEVEAMVREFRARRDTIVAGLNAVPGITCTMPRGAFYAFPNITGLGLGRSAEVADRFLYEAGVAVLAGTSFGRAGEGYLRLSYANSLANIRSAVARIAEWAPAARAPSGSRAG